jgi:hypothetical protein
MLTTPRLIDEGLKLVERQLYMQKTATIDAKPKLE